MFTTDIIMGEEGDDIQYQHTATWNKRWWIVRERRRSKVVSIYSLCSNKGRRNLKEKQ
jgi:hypothetical protein